MKIRFVLLLLLSNCINVVWSAQDQTLQLSRIEQRQQLLSEVREQLAVVPSGTELARYDEQLRQLVAASKLMLQMLQERRVEIESDLALIGEKSELPDIPEAEEITRERQRLLAQLARNNDLRRQSELAIVEAERLLEDIQDIRRESFYSSIFTYQKSLFSPALWRALVPSIGAGTSDLWQTLVAWHQEQRNQHAMWFSYGLIAISIALSVFLLGPIRRWIHSVILHRLEQLQATPGRRAVAAMVRIGAKAFPWVLASCLVVGVFFWQGVIVGEYIRLAGWFLLGLSTIIIIDAAVVATCSPHTPGWRLIPLDPHSVRPLRVFVAALSFIYLVDHLLQLGAELYNVNEDWVLWQSGLVAGLMSVIYLLLVRKSIWRVAEGREDRLTAEIITVFSFIRHVYRGFSYLILLAVLIGYLSLAYYLTTRLFLLAALMACALICRLILHEAIAELDYRLQSVSDKERDQTEDAPGRFVFFWLGMGIDICIVVLVLPIIFLIVGAQWPDIREVIHQIFFGFQLGAIKFSLAAILTAAFTFFVIMTVTRSVQRIAESRLFPKTRMDPGVQQSMSTLIGYVGLTIALVVSFAAIGFNLSNIAIIAGALSVGIGFGLQSIVNNFVSGLILLFERPIKAGDWVIVQSGEGIVKRINVRATEIETFDRSSIIVPNSELISGTVQNWTYKDKVARIIIPVGVAYKEDLEHVEKVLMEAAKSCPLVLSYPEPSVYFVGFGASSLDFELRGFILDVGNFIKAKSDLGKQVFSALKREGIEIPFPQRDVHVKSVQSDSSEQKGSTEATNITSKQADITENKS